MKKERKTECGQCDSMRCGHMHSHRCPVICDYESAELEDCDCSWRPAAEAAGIIRKKKPRRRS